MKKQIWYMRPPIVALILLIIGMVLHFIYPIREIFSFPSNLTGILIGVLGILLAVWGSVSFGKKKVDVIPGSKSREVVVDGPYTFTRNPMYVGMTLLSLGIAILFGV